MGWGAYIDLVRVSDNQHLLPEEIPRFIIKESVDLAPLHAYEYGSHWNITSSVPAVDHAVRMWHVCGQPPVMDVIILSNPALGGFVVLRQGAIDFGSGLGGLSIQEHRETFSKLRPGLWVPTGYYDSNMECANGYTYTLDNCGVTISDRVHWHMDT